MSLLPAVLSQVLFVHCYFLFLAEEFLVFFNANTEQDSGVGVR
jgi:hypothetical protein